MKNNIKRISIIIFLLLTLGGCSFFDPYKEEDYAVKATFAWFDYKENDIDLGSIRRKLENINEIKNVKCKYLENDKYLNYVFSCNITYKPIGETIIPLAQDEEMSVFVVLSYKDNEKFEYIVYNSKSENKIWLSDSTLNYGHRK